MLASDTARTQLRDALLAHIASRQSKAEATPAWTPPADARPPPDSPKLLVGDHRALMVCLPLDLSLSLTHISDPHPTQESLRTFTGTCGLVARQLLASAPPPREKGLVDSAAPPREKGQASTQKHEEGLEWLAAPVAFSASDHDRALTLLRLRHAGFESLPESDQRSAAFDLARDLPFYDAALTAFYMRPLVPALEYELRVGHSVMRLLAPGATYEAYLADHCPNWRDQTGLLHVLAVIAPTTPGLEPLAKTLPLARSHDAAAKSVAAFIQSSPPPHIAAAIDAAAVVMRVKSNPVAGASHSLDAAAHEFAAAAACRIDAESLPALWSGVKTSLERALPPSALRLPAVW